MAGILAASLSTLSSGLNSCALLILKDGLELAFQRKNRKKLRDAVATKLAMLISKSIYMSTYMLRSNQLVLSFREAICLRYQTNHR